MVDAVERDGPLEDSGIVAEPAHPESIRKNRQPILAGCAFIRCEEAAGGGVHAEHGKEVCRSAGGFDALGFVAAGEIDFGRHHGAHALK